MPDSVNSKGESPLDCSRPGIGLFWFGVGIALAVSLLGAAMPREGTLASLLRVGTSNPLFERVHRELGPLPTLDPIGHDGQLYYAIARDPWGTPDTMRVFMEFDTNGPRYRYRRIFFPVLAGGAGYFGPKTTLIGMVVVIVVGFGLMAMALADIAFQFRLSGATPFVALVNPGALVGLLLLTADPFALGLALIAVALALRRRNAEAIAACALAALTKETYLLVPWAFACWHWRGARFRNAVGFALLPVLPLAAWSSWLFATMPDTPAISRNVNIPFRGVLEAVPMWVRQETNSVEMFLALYLCVMMILAILLLFTRRPDVLRWLMVPWILLASVATFHVWAKPNNAARALAILWPLSVTLLSIRSDRSAC